MTAIKCSIKSIIIAVIFMLIDTPLTNHPYLQSDSLKSFHLNIPYYAIENITEIKI